VLARKPGPPRWKLKVFRVRRIGVAGVQHDLAGQFVPQLTREVCKRTVRHGDEDDLDELRCLPDRAGRGVRAKPPRHVCVLCGVAGGEQDLMSRLHPLPADRPAEPACAYDADVHVHLQCEPG
jgi:hypothetical protein